MSRQGTRKLRDGLLKTAAALLAAMVMIAGLAAMPAGAASCESQWNAVEAAIDRGQDGLAEAQRWHRCRLGLVRNDDADTHLLSETDEGTNGYVWGNNIGPDDIDSNEVAQYATGHVDFALPGQEPDPGFNVGNRYHFVRGTPPDTPVYDRAAQCQMARDRGWDVQSTIGGTC